MESITYEFSTSLLVRPHLTTVVTKKSKTKVSTNSNVVSRAKRENLTCAAGKGGAGECPIGVVSLTWPLDNRAWERQ